MAIDPSKIGFSQFVDTFDGQKGTLKEKQNTDGTSTIYMSDKMSSPFKTGDDRRAHLDKQRVPVERVKKALANEYGTTFSNAAIKKLAASKQFLPAKLKAPDAHDIKSLNDKDMAKLKTMTDAAKAHSHRQHATENNVFLERVTGFNTLSDPSQVRDGFMALFEDMIANTQMCDKFGIDTYDRAQVNIGHEPAYKALEVYEDVRGIVPPAEPTAQQVKDMKDVVDAAAVAAGDRLNDAYARLEGSKTWKDMKL